MTQGRNYDDPQYKKFRIDVLRRDKFTCKWPDCNSNRQLKVHHIKTWAEAPDLRFVVANGICLCRTHHDFIWGRESVYAQLFLTILKRGDSNDKRRRQHGKTKNASRVSGKNKPTSKSKKTKKKDESFTKRYIDAKTKRRKGRR